MKTIEKTEIMQKFNDNLIKLAFNLRDKADHKANWLEGHLIITEDDKLGKTTLSEEHKKLLRCYECLMAASASMEEIIEILY